MNLCIRAWVPTWGANDPDYAFSFVGHHDRAKLSDESLNGLVESFIAHGYSEPEDFATWLTLNGYTTFGTAAQKVFVAHLPIEVNDTLEASTPCAPAASEYDPVVIEWTPEDVQKLRPHWTPKMCVEALREIADRLIDRTIDETRPIFEALLDEALRD